MRNNLILIILCFSNIIFAQNTADMYIEKYKSLAMKEMQRSGVPASITLAQGILESASGNSFLAREGNNHFGIKCHNSWTESVIYADDDLKNECFRKYNSPEDSFKDHSDFLRNNSRYHFLFDIDITDYKEWARGLKKAGYATSPTYAEAVINIVEKYNLSQYDFADPNQIEINAITNENNAIINNSEEFIIFMNTIMINNHEVFVYNEIPYIVLDNNVSLKTLAKEINLMKWQLNYYNDLDGRKELNKGEIIYLKAKHSRATNDNKIHIVENNEDLHYISQLYAIKLKKLCRLNNLQKDSVLKIGTKLKLR